MTDNNLTRGGSPVERPAGASSYGACGAPSCTLAWTATVRMLEVELEQLRQALTLIRDTDPVDAILDPDRARRVAQEALSGDD